MFIIIGGVIFSSLLYWNVVSWLTELIKNINSDFFAYLPKELKTLMMLWVLAGIYKIYRNNVH